MKKFLINMLAAGITGAFLSGCTADGVDEQMTTLNATTSTVQVQDISVNELVGTWNMYSMTSVATAETAAVAVDFDQDGSYTYELLEETDCFDSMYFIFDSEGNVGTRQARLFFNSSGDFTCQTTGDYSATYGIIGNELTVTFKVNDIQYKETRTISRFSESGEEFLQVTLTKTETDAAVYIADDPGNTVASQLQKIEMVYKKV